MIHIPETHRLVLVSIRGPMGSGKTTAAEILCREHGFTRLSFATPLKKIVERITPDGKIDKARDRALLQFLGTEYFRTIDPDFWVKQWVKAVAERLELTMGECRIVVDDCRFANEVEAVQRLKGHQAYLDVKPQFRLNRLAARDGVVAEGIEGHASESDLGSDGCLIIDNNGSTRQLAYHLNVFTAFAAAFSEHH